MLVNAQAERLFGYRRADLEEQPVESWCRTRSGPGTVPCGRGMRLTRDDLQRTNRNLESLAYSIAHDLAWKFTAGSDDAVIEFGLTPVADVRVSCYVRVNGAGFDPASRPACCCVMAARSRRVDAMNRTPKCRSADSANRGLSGQSSPGR